MWAGRFARRIVGYVTLSASQIERAFLPKPQQRNRPDPVPVMLLGQLAVDKDFQKQGHAASLLLFALKSALRASEIIGSMGVITHPLDDGVRGFFARWGFQDLPFDPRRAMMVRMVDLQLSFAPADCVKTWMPSRSIQFSRKFGPF
jgi:predicted N-acetyltransferase YhbS